MKIKTILASSLAAGALFAASTPAMAGGWTKHTHYCNCGHSGGGSQCGGTTTTTSGGTTTSSGGTTTSSGGTTTTTSGGTAVPEPGMLGMLGLGVLGMAIARRRRQPRD